MMDLHVHLACGTRVQHPGSTLDSKSVTKIYDAFHDEDQLLLLGQSDPKGLTTPAVALFVEPDPHAKCMGKKAKFLGF